MDHSHHLDAGMFPQFIPQGVDIRGLSPGAVQDDGVGAATGGDVGQAIAEIAVAADDGGVAPLQDVGAGGLHGPRAGGGQGRGHVVFRAEDLPQHLAHFIHHPEEQGVQVTQHRQGHGLEHPGMDGAGAGAQQEARRGLEFLEVGLSHERFSWVRRLQAARDWLSQWAAAAVLFESLAISGGWGAG